MTSSNTGVPDISGSVYTKTQVITDHEYFKSLPYSKELFPFPPCSLNQAEHVMSVLCLTLFLHQSFEKQGFHAGTPAASFSLPSALGSGGPINPPAAAGYAPAPFMHILAPHQQPHSQILHHHLQQDGQVVYILLLLLCLSPSVGAGQLSHLYFSFVDLDQENKIFSCLLVLVCFACHRVH